VTTRRRHTKLRPGPSNSCSLQCEPEGRRGGAPLILFRDFTLSSSHLPPPLIANAPTSKASKTPTPRPRLPQPRSPVPFPPVSNRNSLNSSLPSSPPLPPLTYHPPLPAQNSQKLYSTSTPARKPSNTRDLSPPQADTYYLSVGRMEWADRIRGCAILFPDTQPALPPCSQLPPPLPLPPPSPHLPSPSNLLLTVPYGFPRPSRRALCPGRIVSLPHPVQRLYLLSRCSRAAVAGRHRRRRCRAGGQGRGGASGIRAGL
jgi:hypothetical protein